MTGLKASLLPLALSGILLGSVAGTIAAPAPSDLQQTSRTRLAVRVQAELARVGCYRQPVDGDWKSGSRKATSDYLQRTNQGGGSLEPSADLLSDIASRSGRVCGSVTVSRETIFGRPLVRPVAYRPGGLADNYLSRLPVNAVDPASVSPIIGLN